MKDATLPARRALRLLAALLLLVVPACVDRADVEPAEEVDMEAAGETTLDMNGAPLADTTRLRTTFDEIGEHYAQMMAGYEHMNGQLSPEDRRLYERMQQQYDRVMPEGMMGQGMMAQGNMGRHMMSMHDRGAWSREMLDLHREMARRYAQEGHDEMAEMHEQMAALYRDALDQMPDPDADPAP